MAIQEFDQTTVFNNPDLPSGALSSKQFNTIVEFQQGQIEVTTVKSWYYNKTSTVFQHLRIIFLNGTRFYRTDKHHKTWFNYKMLWFSCTSAKHLLMVPQIWKLKVLLVQQ